MRDAPVGQQCVECVREGSRGRRQRSPRNLVGGLTVSSGTWVTWTFLALNVLMFLGQMVDRRLTGELLVWGAGVGEGQWYRLLTGTFLHAGWLHILVNMYALFIVGPNLERVLGHWRYAVLYLVSGLCGSCLSVAVSGATAQSVGASGAIFGLFGATFVVFRRLGRQTGWIVSTILINLVITFFFAGIIDWKGHVGGLVAGLAIAAAYAYAPRASRLVVQLAVPIALLVIAFAAVAWRV